MNILIITPAPQRSRQGNRMTALRWQRLLDALGHRVRIAQSYQRQRCDLLIALHARKSAPAVQLFRAAHPHKPLVVALTGTDLYRDLPRSAAARTSLQLADRLVVLQESARENLDESFRGKTRVIYQSAVPLPNPPEPLTDLFEVSVIGHLRPEKDPFRAAMAVRQVPAASRLHVTHVGAALSEAMRQRAEREMQRNRRYQWLGERSHLQTLRLLSRSRVLVISSKLEGGANVLSEALAAEIPVIATCIPGNTGLLGPKYPGYFPVGDTVALRNLLLRCENDSRFYRRLMQHCQKRRGLVRPEREQHAWESLLAELQENA